jgi:UDP-N-acetylmuramoylalanine--D-glutamate ligase
LQFIGEFRGRRFYDDSKATTPEAAMAALSSFESPIVLLAGGYDKHIDLSDLAARICERTKAVALLGQTAPLLAQQLARQNERFAATGGSASRPPNTSIPESFPEAVHWAIKQSAPGDVVLLSPGCASYGWFPNYVHRGRDFSDLVQAWGEEGAAAQER